MPFINLRATGARLAAMQDKVETDLALTYVPGAARSIIVRDPVISAGHVSIVVDVKFYEFIESVSLVAEVFV